MDIYLTSKISDIDVYPLSHIYVTELSLITKIAPQKIFQAITSLYYVLFVIFMYLFSNIFLNKKQTFLVTIASTVFLLSASGYYSQNMPFGLGSLLFPLFLFLFFRYKYSENNGIQFAIITIITVFSIPFLHPLTAIFLTFIFLIFAISPYLKAIMKKLNIMDSFKSDNKSLFNLPLILIISLITWISSNFLFWKYSFGNTLKWLLNEASAPSTFDSLNGGVSKLNLNIMDIIALYLKNYGHSFLYIIISLLVILFLAKKIMKDDNKKNDILIILVVYFFITMIFSTIGVFAPTIYFFGWRYITLLLIVTPIFVGLALFKLLNSPKKIFTSIVILVIFLPSIVGIFSVYPSPYTDQPNAQVTYSEITGYHWLISNRNPFIQMNYNKEARRFTDAIYGASWKTNQSGINPISSVSGPLDNFPDHFGTDDKTLSESLKLKRPIYFQLNKFDELYYTDLFKKLNKFDKKDFLSIDTDNSVDKIYNNGEMNVFFVNPSAYK
ncbi:hypothetical protein J2749_002196 [Methanobacterium oryzae]